MAAQTALFKLCGEVISWMSEVGEISAKSSSKNQLKKYGKPNKKYQAEFEASITDDLNTAQAIAILWNVAKDASVPPVEKLATILDFDQVLGLRLSELAPVPTRDVPPEIVALADAREEARKAKDFAQADALRAEIESRGFTVKDTNSGPKIEEI
jgi:cysteinyl-tRNA synthetase